MAMLSVHASATSDVMDSFQAAGPVAAVQPELFGGPPGIAPFQAREAMSVQSDVGQDWDPYMQPPPYQANEAMSLQSDFGANGPPPPLPPLRGNEAMSMQSDAGANIGVISRVDAIRMPPRPNRSDALASKKSDVAEDATRPGWSAPDQIVVKVKCPGCMRCLAPAEAVPSRDLTVLSCTPQSVVYQCSGCSQAFETPVYIDKKFLVVKGIRQKLRAYRNRHENARTHYAGYYNAMMMPTIFLSATLSIVSAYGGEEEEDEGASWFWWRKMATTCGNAINTILIALIALFKFQGLMEQHGQASKMYDSLLVELEYKVEHRLSFVKHAGTPLDLSEYSKIDVAIAEFLKYAESRIAEIDGNTPVVPEHLKEGHEPTGEHSLTCCMLRAFSCLLPMLVNTFFVVLRFASSIVTIYLAYRIYKDVDWADGKLHGLRWYHSMILVTSLLVPTFRKYFLYIWQIAMLCVACFLTFHIFVDLAWDKYPDFHAMGLQWFHFMVIPAIAAAVTAPQFIMQYDVELDLDNYQRSILALIDRALGSRSAAPRDVELGMRAQRGATASFDAAGEIVIVGRPYQRPSSAASGGGHARAALGAFARSALDEHAPLLALTGPEGPDDDLDAIDRARMLESLDIKEVSLRSGPANTWGIKDGREMLVTSASSSSPDAKKWTCPQCTLGNDASASTCAICETPRPGLQRLASAGLLGNKDDEALARELALKAFGEDESQDRMSSGTPKADQVLQRARTQSLYRR